MNTYRVKRKKTRSKDRVVYHHVFQLPELQVLESREDFIQPCRCEYYEKWNDNWISHVHEDERKPQMLFRWLWHRVAVASWSAFYLKRRPLVHCLWSASFWFMIDIVNLHRGVPSQSSQWLSEGPFRSQWTSTQCLPAGILLAQG